MARPRQHKSLDCSGTIQTVYVRRGAEGRPVPLGSICTGCETFVRDEGALSPEEAVSEARISAELIGRDLSDLACQLALFDRLSRALTDDNSAPTSDDSPSHVLQRWYGSAMSLALRRHLEEDARSVSLRGLLDLLRADINAFTLDRIATHFGGPSSATFPRNIWSDVCDSSGVMLNATTIDNDRTTLSNLARRTRRYTSALIHRSDVDLLNSASVLHDIEDALYSVRDLARKYLVLLVDSNVLAATVSQISQLQALEIATSNSSSAPYEVGAPGVPFDARPYIAQIANVKPYISLVTTFDGQLLSLHARNVGLGAARRFKVFIPRLGAHEIDELIPAGGSAELRVTAPDDTLKSGVQYVIEFEDIHGYLYRQYAQVMGNWRASETGIPYLVEKRIVGQ